MDIFERKLNGRANASVKKKRIATPIGQIDLGTVTSTAICTSHEVTRATDLHVYVEISVIESYLV